MANPFQVPLKGKKKKLVKILGGGVVNTEGTPAGQILGVATPATPVALTPIAVKFCRR